MILKILFILIITTVKTTTLFEVSNKTTDPFPVIRHSLNANLILNSSETNGQFIDIVMSTESDWSIEYIFNSIQTNGLYFIEELIDKCSQLLTNNNKIQVWLMSVLCSTVIGVSSMFPLFLISISNQNYLINSDSSSKTLLKYLLSFAVGGLLGDVFLHLLPEASEQALKMGLSVHSVQRFMGFWILTGILCFVFTETFFSHLNNDNKDDNNSQTTDPKINDTKNKSQTNGQIFNGFVKTDDNKCNPNVKSNITGYLNLLANSFDNLTHGMAVGASFLVSIKMGLLTTFAIAIHEIPHEIGDFAILIKSGFTKWQAVRAQVSIACVTVIGALIILFADSADVMGTRTAWILPFTSGGFLHIALVSILPELLAEKDFYQSLRQSLFVCAGVAVMAFVNLIGE